MEEYYEFDPKDFEVKEDEEKREENPLFKFFKGAVALFVILGMLHIFGFSNFFRYRTTSPEIEQEEVGAKVDAEIIEVPLNIVVLTTKEEGFGSKRNERSVESLVRNADRIWEQAGIDLIIKSINYEEVQNDILGDLYNNPRLVVENIENFDPESINVFLVGNLGGINGVSFGGFKMVAVADFTTVYDFRTLAHEIGHQLGLVHLPDSRLLMFQGANGFNLSIEEIEEARTRAKFF